MADYLMPQQDPRDLSQAWADALATEGLDALAAALVEALQGAQQ